MARFDLFDPQPFASQGGGGILGDLAWLNPSQGSGGILGNFVPGDGSNDRGAIGPANFRRF